jgi:hypothetical protein
LEVGRNAEFGTVGDLAQLVAGGLQAQAVRLASLTKPAGLPTGTLLGCGHAYRPFRSL